MAAADGSTVETLAGQVELPLFNLPGGNFANLGDKLFRAFFQFDTFVFPGIVKVIYWIGLVVIVLATIAGVVGAITAGVSPYAHGGPIVGVVGFILAIVLGMIGLVIWRVVVELWLVLFSIHDVLREIRDQRRSA